MDYATIIGTSSAAVLTLGGVAHGAYYVGKRLFVTIEKFEALEKTVTKNEGMTQKVIDSLDKIHESIETGNELTKGIAESFHAVDKRLSVAEDRISRIGGA